MFNDIHVRLVIELIQRVELSSPRKFRTINNIYKWDLIFLLLPMQTLPPSTSLHAKNIYAYAGSSFFTAGLGEGPKNASGITDEWW